MAVLSLRFQSKLLGFSTAVRILIPTEWGKEFDYKAYYAVSYTHLTLPTTPYV